MVEQLTLPGVVEPEAAPAVSGGRAFTQWLRLQLRARKLTQRQLAQKSGVDHSTISRLTRGNRTPSLRTATLLARGLGFPQDLGWLDGQSFGRSDTPAARVEYALRSDGLLTEAAVGRIMKVYLAARLRPLPASPPRFPSKRQGRLEFRSSSGSPGCVLVRPSSDGRHLREYGPPRTTSS